MAQQQRRLAVLSAQVVAGNDPHRSDKTLAEYVRLPWCRFPPRVAGRPGGTEYRTVKYSVEDGICTIVRSRPNVLNAVNFQTHCDMIAAFEEAEQDDFVLAVVLTGDGRFFCSGADVAGNEESYDMPDPPRVQEIKKVLLRQDDHDSNSWSDVNMYDAWINFSKPLIIAVNGPAIGEGFTTLMMGDIIYASDSAYFWAPFARFGVVPEITSTVTLPQRVGMAVAAEMLLMSKKKTPEEMLRAGLINEVLPAGDGFLPAVKERMKSGLNLAGDPSVRLKALRMFKSMLKTKEWRDRMVAQNRNEQEMVRQRVRDGDIQKNLAFYAAQMPQKKK
eukprot:CAMPEP_0203972992 /NCGR_PEP_ID=MMETSP0359-20131031/99357_1 /ASSEMBLY_ACC=CAM_ASM_000338 /TAXON_ID=268821 /ORGANISM="Scrippsiella Hangoei, Strain SHTV-5" /LENGTH=331 /DNA_ID=CAMNT_0050911131 /DNA_START=21 /DNA_END=1016 /DNA_ORIENTATION=+